MIDAKGTNTPLPAGWKPISNTDAPNPKLRQEYQSIIGSLLYIMLGTRPDISYAVTLLTQFAANPSREHLEKAKYIMRYLKANNTCSIIFDGKSNLGLIAYTDSDWPADVIKRRSVTGFTLMLAGG